MELKTMRTTSPAALAKAIQESQGRLRELGFQLASQRVKNVREVRELKKDIARMQMVLREKLAADAKAA
jgi:ribosomal protein L29